MEVLVQVMQTILEHLLNIVPVTTFGKAFYFFILELNRTTITTHYLMTYVKQIKEVLWNVKSTIILPPEWWITRSK